MAKIAHVVAYATLGCFSISHSETADVVKCVAYFGIAIALVAEHLRHGGGTSSK